MTIVNNNVLNTVLSYSEAESLTSSLISCSQVCRDWKSSVGQWIVDNVAKIVQECLTVSIGPSFEDGLLLIKNRFELIGTRNPGFLEGKNGNPITSFLGLVFKLNRDENLKNRMAKDPNIMRNPTWFLDCLKGGHFPVKEAPQFLIWAVTNADFMKSEKYHQILMNEFSVSEKGLEDIYQNYTAIAKEILTNSLYMESLSEVPVDNRVIAINPNRLENVQNQCHELNITRISSADQRISVLYPVADDQVQLFTQEVVPNDAEGKCTLILIAPM